MGRDPTLDWEAAQPSEAVPAAAVDTPRHHRYRLASFEGEGTDKMKTGELGNKFECPNCGTKYYDLGKPDPHCPKCGADVEGVIPEEEPESGEEE